MEYRYLKYDPQYFSFNLRLTTGENRLTWEGAARQDALLVQTPFEQDALDYIQQFCKRQEGWEDVSRRPEYFPVEKGIFFRFVTAAERSRDGGCPLNGRACTYTLFSCRKREANGAEICEVFEPLIQTMNPVVCHVPHKIPVSLTRVPERRNLFQRVFHLEGNATPVYQISFPDRDDSCEDGDLIYQVGKFVYPILHEMYQAGRFYVRSREKPVIKSRNPGLSVVQDRRR